MSGVYRSIDKIEGRGSETSLQGLIEAVRILKEESKRLQEAREKDSFRFAVTSLIVFFGPVVCAVVAAWLGARWGAETAKAEFNDELEVMTARLEHDESTMTTMSYVAEDAFETARMLADERDELELKINQLCLDRDRFIEMAASMQLITPNVPRVTGHDKFNLREFIPDFESPRRIPE